MSEHHLPADVNQWPNNPFELLNVPRQVEAAELRKAYVKLIRVFKPEHFPEQFRRIRAAYETIQARLNWGQHEEIEFHVPRAPDLPPPDSLSETKPHGDRSDFQPQPLPFEPISLDAIWKQAVDGDAALAYGQLVELELRDQGNYELCLRLYWLGKLYSHLNAVREPCDWLARGILRNSQMSPLVDLYRREIAANPAECLTDRCGALLHVASQASVMAAIAEARWQAARQLNRGDVVIADLDALRPRLSQATRAIWCRMLLMAIDAIAWIRDPQLRQTLFVLRREFEANSSGESELDSAQVRLDMLFEMVDEFDVLHTCRDLPQGLVRLIPQTWPHASYDVCQQLMRCLEEVFYNQNTMFVVFDRLAERAPHCAAYLAELLNTAPAYASFNTNTVGELAALTRHFLNVMGGQTYDQLRPHLLQFCLREQIAPNQLSRLPMEATTYRLKGAGSLVDLARNDAALCLAYRANEALWSGAV